MKIMAQGDFLNRADLLRGITCAAPAHVILNPTDGYRMERLVSKEHLETRHAPPQPLPCVRPFPMFPLCPFDKLLVVSFEKPCRPIFIGEYKDSLLFFLERHLLVKECGKAVDLPFQVMNVLLKHCVCLLTLNGKSD